MGNKVESNDRRLRWPVLADRPNVRAQHSRAPALGFARPAPVPNPLAIGALVCAVVGMSPLPIFFFVGFFAYLAVWAAAIGLGVVAYGQIARSEGAECGYSMAIVGIAVGGVALVSVGLIALGGALLF